MKHLLAFLAICLCGLGVVLFASPPPDCVLIKISETDSVTTYSLENYLTSGTFKELPLEYLQKGVREELDRSSLKAVCILANDSVTISSIRRVLETTQSLKLRDVRLMTIPDSSPGDPWQIVWEFRLWNPPNRFKQNK